jgi:hypothetical protein
MPISTHSKTSPVQPTGEVTPPRDHHTPRRLLRSRQGNAGVIISYEEGSPSVIRARGNDLAAGFTISKCADTRCKTCPYLITSKSFKSTVTNKTYKIKNHTGENLSCHSRNIVYLLTCKRCGTQYTGETAEECHIRMNGHRTSKVGCEHVISHYTKVCSSNSFSIQIIEKLPGTGYDQFNVLCEQQTRKRRDAEDDWMKKLRTIYPYGLNELAKSKLSNCSVQGGSVGHLFPPIPRNGDRPNRSRINRNNKSSSTSSEDFFTSVDDLLTNDIMNSFHKIRCILNNTKKKILKEIAFNIIHRENFEFHAAWEQWYRYILDIIDTKLYKPSQPKKEKVPPKNVCVVSFVNKGIDLLNLPSIFKSPDITSLLPECMQSEEDCPMVTMKLTKPIRNKILNYQETVLSIDNEIITAPCECNCKDSAFRDPYHQHIVTGDLRIIENLKLRKLLSKGPNYRENRTINYSKCLQAVERSLDESCLKYVRKYNLPANSFDLWKRKILEKVRTKIKILRKQPNQIVKPILDDPEVKEYLENLHKHFVIVPIDKASNNFSVICKYFYIKVLVEEVGILNGTSSTYTLSSIGKTSIIDNNILVCNRYNLSVSEKEKRLPYMYWMPKMHKHPSKARFIIASASCSTKPLSKTVSKVFKLLFQQIKSFHHKSLFYKNYNFFWVVDNSTTIIEKLHHINEKKKAKEISTYDFSTLYTKIEHLSLIRVLHEIIDFVFKGGNRRYIACSNNKAYWCKLKPKGVPSFTKTSLKAVVEHLIRHSYFEIGSFILCQSIGIPMGIDPAPFWANLYLYFYENKFIKDLMKTNPTDARKFLHATRFIDDECNLNDSGAFTNYHQRIYPPELELKCEHQGTHATFLDLDINVVENIFVYKLFDKRDEFPFSIIKMPDRSSNIPRFIFYGTIMSEFIRIARSTLLLNDFLPRASGLFSRMVSQGGDPRKVLGQIKKSFSRHTSIFEKYEKTSQQIVELIQRT